MRQKFPQASRRTVLIKVVTPHPEVVKHIDGWLKRYINGELRQGGATESSFAVFLDPSTDEIHIAEAHQILTPTATFYIEEQTCWIIAARTESCYTAWIKGMPIRIESSGDMIIRDVELVDEILDIYYKLMMEAGHDLAALFGGR